MSQAKPEVTVEEEDVAVEDVVVEEEEERGRKARGYLCRGARIRLRPIDYERKSRYLRRGTSSPGRHDPGFRCIHSPIFDIFSLA